jgi:hypothetical protein
VEKKIITAIIGHANEEEIVNEKLLGKMKIGPGKYELDYN